MMDEPVVRKWAEEIARGVLGEDVEYVSVCGGDSVTICIKIDRDGTTLTFDQLSTLADRFGSKAIDLTASDGSAWSEVTPGDGANFQIGIRRIVFPEDSTATPGKRRGER